MNNTIECYVINDAITKQPDEKTKKPSFVDVMEPICKDANNNPKQYLEEVFVPHGGE